jgi:CheY-like chemotaxis protein
MGVDKLHIFLVDDDVDEHYIFASHLEKVAPHVGLSTFVGWQEFKSYLGSMKMTSQQRLLVLMDLDMPVISGAQAIESIRKDAKYRSLPIIVYTHSTSPEDIKRCYMIGANSYVVKPEVPEQSIALIHKLIDYWTECSLTPESY